MIGLDIEGVPQWEHVAPPHFRMPEAEVHPIELDDEPWMASRPWWARVMMTGPYFTDPGARVDVVCGPEYRMWMERLR